MVAPGTIAPVASVTVPVMLAKVVCEYEVRTKPNSNTVKQNRNLV